MTLERLARRAVGRLGGEVDNKISVGGERDNGSEERDSCFETSESNWGEVGGEFSKIV